MVRCGCLYFFSCYISAQRCNLPNRNRNLLASMPLLLQWLSTLPPPLAASNGCYLQADVGCLLKVSRNLRQQPTSIYYYTVNSAAKMSKSDYSSHKIKKNCWEKKIIPVSVLDWLVTVTMLFFAPLESKASAIINYSEGRYIWYVLHMCIKGLPARAFTYLNVIQKKSPMFILNWHLPAAWGPRGSVFVPSQVAPWVASAETDRLCMWRPSVSSAAAVVFMTSASTCLNFLFAVSKTFLKTTKVDLNHNFSKQEFLILTVCNCYLKQERIKCMNHYMSLD